MVAAAQLTGGGQASWLWLFAYFVVLTVGELYLSPTSLSLVTKVAPAGVLSMMMGVWLATSFVGGFLAGYLGTFWSSMSKPGFFLMLAVISAARRPGHRAAASVRCARCCKINRAAARHIARPANVAAASERVEIIEIGELTPAVERRSRAGSDA